MRSAAVVSLAVIATVGCARVLGLDDYGETGPGGQAGSGGDTGAGAAGGQGVAGSSQGGSGMAGAGGMSPSCSEDYVGLVLADGPVAYVRLEEVSGPTALEQITQVTGSVDGGVLLDQPSLVPCAPSRAALFDGAAGSRIDFGPMLAFDAFSPFTIEVWIRSQGFVGAIIRNLSASPASGYSLAFSNNELRFHRYNNGNSNSVVALSNVVGANATHHVVGSFDGTDMCLYVDGMLQECKPTTLSVGGSGNFTIGTSNYVGAIDEVAIYASGLSAQQVQAHYQAAMSVVEP